LGKFVYTGEAEIVLPTLGLTVSNGDVIDAPDDFAVAGFEPSKGKTVKVTDASADAADTTDTAPAATN
jgi:hypothetical protein